MNNYYSYDIYNNSDFFHFSAGVWFFFFAIMIVSIIAQWKLFEKAGEPGWASIIPIYNTYILYKIALGNGWLFLINLIPFIGFIVQIVMLFELPKTFGKSIGWSFGMIFLTPIFLCLLAFNDDIEYIGPNLKK